MTQNGHSIGDRVEQVRCGVSHSYTLVARWPHINRHGHATEVLTWEGRCPACERVFEATSGPKIFRDMPRGCQLHRPWVNYAAISPSCVMLRRKFMVTRQRWKIMRDHAAS
jgi:hypothetical protein